MIPDLDELDRHWLQRLRRNLRRWYSRYARDLPWRENSDPYRIWISEIMLQQTTVAAVVPYFERFLKRFPTVHRLASAPESDVLRLWEGLGYYSRARNIHKTACLLVEQHAGQFPGDVTKLMELPGIGRYTAGAISSFAFDHRAPIVEANTLRLYTRLLGYRGDPRSTEGQQLLWEFAEAILPRKDPGIFNQALMEVGSIVCTPVEPDCHRCPLRSCCCASREGTQAAIPQPASRPQVTHITEATVAVRHNETFLLIRRGEGERWAGLWDFPRFVVDDKKQSFSRSRKRDAHGTNGFETRRFRRKLESEIVSTTGMNVELSRMLTEMNHSVTRYRIRLLCFLAEHRSGDIDPEREMCWVAPEEFDAYPLSVTGRKFAKLLAESPSPSAAADRD